MFDVEEVIEDTDRVRQNVTDTVIPARAKEEVALEREFWRRLGVAPPYELPALPQDTARPGDDGTKTNAERLSMLFKVRIWVADKFVFEHSKPEIRVLNLRPRLQPWPFWRRRMD